LALSSELEAVVTEFKTTVEQRVEVVRQMIRELEALFKRHEQIQSCHMDTQRVKNAIDLAQKDIFQKRQVAISLAAEVQKQKDQNDEIDREIEQFR
jgi:hypothetical protein